MEKVASAPAIALGVTLPLLLLPDGQLRSPRWRPLVVASLSGAVLVVAGGLAPGPLTGLPITNPLALVGWAGTAATVADAVGGMLHVGSLVAALVCVVLRFRSSRGIERQQLRWVAAGGAAGVVGLLAVTALLVGGALFGFTSGGWLAVILLTLPCMPGAIAVAVLRYRLWDLDRLVSRTVTYALVTALLVLPYLLILPAGTRLAAGSGSLAVAAATLAAAALFQPVRRWVQGLADPQRQVGAGSTGRGGCGQRRPPAPATSEWLRSAAARDSVDSPAGTDPRPPRHRQAGDCFGQEPERQLPRVDHADP